MNHSTRRRQGFTLVEMIIVASIIAMLAALLLPAISATRESARGASCQSNLHHIGLAYAQRQLSEGRQGEPIWSGSWMGKLDPYMEKAAKIYRCPSSVAALNSGKGAYVQSSHTAHGSGGKPIQIPMEPGHRRCRQSTRFDAEVLATGNPAAYALEFEGNIQLIPENVDYNELALLLVPDYVNQETRIEVLEVTQDFGDVTDTFQIYGPDGNLALGGIQGSGAKGMSCVIRGAGLTTYGMNNYSNQMGDDGHKILLMDYNLANIRAAWTGQADYPDQSIIYFEEVAPRHHEQLNVLYVNGGVKRMTAEPLNFMVRAIHDRYWKPRNWVVP